MVGHWTHRKRRAQVEPVDERDDVVDELAQLRIFRDQLTQPLKTSGCFDLRHESEKRLIQATKYSLYSVYSSAVWCCAKCSEVQ